MLSQFGKLSFDPAHNPAVLDTATWDLPAAAALVSAAATYLRDTPLQDAQQGLPAALTQARIVGQQGASLYFLLGLADGQEALVRVGQAGTSALGQPAFWQDLGGGQGIALHAADAATVDRFFRQIDGTRAPRGLGPVPRLGIGTRMTTLVWPAIWQTMRREGFASNAIQNSVRELNLLESLLDARPPEQNVAFNFGTIETGYTGSSFEGLWLAGALSALAAGEFPTAGYGADADHIQVKRGAAGLARARRLVDAARYYTFFTLDVSDVLDYAALLDPSPAAAEAAVAARIPDQRSRAALLAEYSRPRRVAGREYRLDGATTCRLIAKYWDALAATEQLAAQITSLKDGVPFDLELSIDEHPGEVATFASLTSDQELVFVLGEMRRRGIPLTHVAPNLGVEKGVDYACPDGLPGLEQRSALLGRIAAEFGVMVDVHSGDDLSQATRQALRRALGGRVHFKVSPILQLLFGEVLAAHEPELFRRWWEDARAYAQHEAASGSAFAAACLEEAAAHGNRPSPHDAIFHHFSFAFVGRRDASGRFLYRDEFYSLGTGFRTAYQQRIEDYLSGLAADLL